MTTKTTVFFVLGSCAFSLFFLSCASIKVQKDYLYIPISETHSGVGASESAVYDRNEHAFSGIGDLSTVGFFRGEGDGPMKKVEGNGISLYSVTRQDLKKVKPNTEDLLLMKTGFDQGYDLTIFALSSWSEYAYPNKYFKKIYVDVDNVKNGYYTTDFALMAVNIGNSTIKELKIIDAIPENFELLGSKFATDDAFIPLNVKLAKVKAVKHSITKEANKTVVVYDVDSDGIKPAEMVEIIVSVKIKIPDKKM